MRPSQLLLLILLATGAFVAVEYNVNYTSAIIHPPAHFTIPFRYFPITVQLNDSREMEGDCVYMKCSVYLQYFNRDIHLTTKVLSDTREVCGGENTLRFTVPTEIDYEDYAGNWHQTTPSLMKVNVTCTRSDDSEGTWATSEYHLSVYPSIINLLLLLLWLASFVGTIWLLYSDYGVILAVGTIAVFLLTSMVMAADGLLPSWFYSEVMLLLLVFVNVFYLIAVIRMAFETRRQALEEL